jgi:hypothetical protein
MLGGKRIGKKKIVQDYEKINEYIANGFGLE